MLTILLLTNSERSTSTAWRKRSSSAQERARDLVPVPCSLTLLLNKSGILHRASARRADRSVVLRLRLSSLSR
jgi:hypothetical protein